MSPEFATREEFVRVETKIDLMTDILTEMRPLLLESSGDRVKMAQMRRDLDKSHTRHNRHSDRLANLKDEFQADRDEANKSQSLKLTAITERLSRMEKREIRVAGVVIGVVGTLQVVAPSIADSLKGLLGLL